MGVIAVSRVVCEIEHTNVSCVGWRERDREAAVGPRRPQGAGAGARRRRHGPCLQAPDQAMTHVSRVDVRVALTRAETRSDLQLPRPASENVRLADDVGRIGTVYRSLLPGVAAPRGGRSWADETTWIDSTDAVRFSTHPRF